MRSNKIEDYKKTLKLSKRQKDVLIGTLLGDACLETMSGGRIYRLKVEHSMKQKEYVEWKYLVFRKWVLTGPKETVSENKNNYRFSTLSHGAFRFYGQQFYKNGKKVIPKFISKLLSPIALAVWFMDDGSVKSNQHRALVIHSQNFGRDDLKRIIKVLDDKYGIRSNLRKRNDGEGYVIYILSETVDKFVNLIKPYILPSMRYKLGNILPKE